MTLYGYDRFPLSETAGLLNLYGWQRFPLSLLPWVDSLSLPFRVVVFGATAASGLMVLLSGLWADRGKREFGAGNPGSKGEEIETTVLGPSRGAAPENSGPARDEVDDVDFRILRNFSKGKSVDDITYSIESLVRSRVKTLREQGFITDGRELTKKGYAALKRREMILEKASVRRA